MVKYIVYVIENQDNRKIYIGSTSDLEKRLARHRGNLPARVSSYTRKNHGDWRLIYSELFDTRIGAVRREKQLKTSRGRNFLKQFRRIRP